MEFKHVVKAHPKIPFNKYYVYENMYLSTYYSIDYKF